MMIPVGRLVMLRATEKRDLVRLISYIALSGLVAPVLGPPVGGAITTYLGWRWILLPKPSMNRLIVKPTCAAAREA